MRAAHSTPGQRFANTLLCALTGSFASLLHLSHDFGYPSTPALASLSDGFGSVGHEDDPGGSN